jgi:lipid-A-disaccharide synthase
MKYYLIAGERSGDLHAANLIKALKREDSQATFRAWGGDAMQKAGAELVRHYRELAFMGFWEVFKNLRTLSRFINECQADILANRPEVLILVDYAGFNLRIAKFARANGIKVFYYISPKVWAWNQKRAWKIKALVDRMFVIFPFEKEFYRKFAYEVDYVGNPLLDEIAAFAPDPSFRQQHQLDDKPIIALLPGSRQQEVEKMLEVMLSVKIHLPGYQFVVAAVTNLPATFYEGLARQYGIRVVYDKSYDLLAQATAALVTSGTATLETALFEVPQVVCYRLSWASYQITKMLIRVKFISLVNLIANREVVPELIQAELNPDRLLRELQNILPGSAGRETQLAGYREIKEMMGTAGASATTARLMVGYLG